MTREGIDFSGPHPSAEAMRQAGRDFVLRYARKTGTKDKQITVAEAAYWRANRIDVGIVEESLAERALAGRAAGAADATAARSAVRAVGGPDDGGVIYMAVDFQPTGGQMAAVLDYLRGAASVLGVGRTGVYGSYAVCEQARGAGACRYLWQTYAWSGGLVLPGIHLYQYSNSHTLGGVDVDYNRTSVADWGQWPTTYQEDDMSLTPEEHGLLVDVRTGVNTLLGQLDPAKLGGLVDKINRTGEALERVRQVLTAGIAADAGRDKDIAAAVAAQAAVLAILGEQLSRAAAGDVDEVALAAALAPAVGDALALQLAARLAS